MHQLSLHHSILAVLAYADLFDTPLTVEEIWRNLFFPAQKNISFFDVMDALDSDNLRLRVDSRGGCYFLKGRQACVDLRLQRYTIAERKYRKAKKVARILAVLPFVRMVCACNTLGWNNARDESDIDFFIIAQHSHLWLARLLCAGLMQLCGLRPRKERMRDAVCLSFFASDGALDFFPLFLKERDSVPDVYFLYWIPHCVPIYDSSDRYEYFWRANRKTVLSALPYACSYDTNVRRRVRIWGIQKAVKIFFEWCICVFGSLPERMARALQMRALPRYLSEIVNKDTRVVMSDRIMKFHPNDRREEIRTRFIEKLKELGIV